MACHNVDKKIVGPAYKDVAAKYKGDANAPEMLEAKVARAAPECGVRSPCRLTGTTQR